MRGLVRRMAFGLFWFGVFWVALLVVGTGIAGAVAGEGPPPNASFSQGPDRGHPAESVAGRQFQERYGRWVVVVAAMAAASCTVAGILPGTRR